MSAVGTEAASAGRAVSEELGSDGVMVVTLDVPGEKVNTLSRTLMTQFAALLGAAPARTQAS